MTQKVVKIYLTPEELASAHEQATPGAKQTLGLKLGSTEGLQKHYKEALAERSKVREQRELLLETTAKPFLDLAVGLCLTPRDAAAYIEKFMEKKVGK